MNAYLNGAITSAMSHFAKYMHSHKTIKLAKQYLPYAIYPRGEGVTPSHIVLNREYKPIGFPTSENYHFNYADPMFDVFSINIESSDNKPIFLYGGIHIPWLSKLEAESYKQKVFAIIWRSSHGK
jgi:hypothetical protein